jgi:hypothetical protein
VRWNGLENGTNTKIYIKLMVLKRWNSMEIEIRNTKLTISKMKQFGN